MRKIIGVAGTAAAASLLSVLAAVPASASLGGPLYASCATNDGGACAGAVATTAAGFRYVTASGVDRNPDQYAGITNGLGWQVGLKGASADAIIGISDVPDSGAGYSPQSLVYQGGALVAVAPNAVWCAAGQPCQPASAGGAFPVGELVKLSVFYSRVSGAVNFTASDPAGNVYRASYTVGTTVAFGQARIEAGYGTYTAPAAVTKLVGFSEIGMTSAPGVKLNLRSAAVVRHREFGTSDGTATGVRQAGPGTVNAAGTGFPVNFLP